MLVPALVRAPLRRLWRAALTPLRGRMRHEREDVALAIPFPFGCAEAAPKARIGVVCHIFHEDLAAEFRQALDRLPAPADLFLSTDHEAKRGAIQRAFADWQGGSVDVRVFPNRGRDIGPKFAGFANVYPNYDLVLFLHSKKSLTSSLGDDWRQLLLDTLIGSGAEARSILSLFDADPRLGIVMPQHFAPIRGLLHWDGNFGAATTLARRMGLPLRRAATLDFPSGSMFWARPDALRPLLDLQLGFDDFPAEANQVRGTPQHAVERLMLLVAEAAGYRWIKVEAVRQAEADTPLVRVTGPGSLAAVTKAHSVSLLPQHAGSAR